MATPDSNKIPTTVENLIGKRFGRLTVLRYAFKRKSCHYWHCECECGKRLDVYTGSLRKKVQGEKSCGCYNRERASKQLQAKLQDLTGRRFDRYTVVEHHHTKETKYGTRHYWLARCNCGNERIVRGDTLKNPHVKSCGCYRTEIVSKLQSERARTHGMSKTSIYTTWISMRDRCHNPDNAAYEHYGGRGISVCKRWRESFRAFYKDMGKPPTKKHSLERIDNNKGYSPTNCKWATKREQMNNTRKNRYIKIDGVEKTVSQWSRLYRINRSTIQSRLSRGWDEVSAVITPVHKTS